MKRITDKEYIEYQDYKRAKVNGRVLSPDGLRLICKSYNNNPTEIGKHFLETLHRFEQESAFSEKNIE